MATVPPIHRFGVLMRRTGLDRPPWKWRMPPIETDPELIAFAQTIPGKLSLFLIFAMLLTLLGGYSWQLALALSLTASLAGSAGRYRYLIAAAGGAALLLLHMTGFAPGLESLILEQQGLQGTFDHRWIRAGSLLAAVPLLVAVNELVPAG